MKDTDSIPVKFTVSAIKMLQTRWLHSNELSSAFGSWSSKVKVLAGLVSFEVALLSLQMAIILLCPHMVFLCVPAPQVSLCVLITFSYKDPSQAVIRKCLKKLILMYGSFVLPHPSVN